MQQRDNVGREVPNAGMRERARHDTCEREVPRADADARQVATLPPREGDKREEQERNEQNNNDVAVEPCALDAVDEAARVGERVALVAAVRRALETT